MDIQTFLINLKRHADLFTESSQSSSDFFSFFEANYDVYRSATPEERETIREFVKSPPEKEEKPQSFFGKLFGPRSKNSQIAHLLLLYVKEKALPQLKSTKDPVWLYRGLTAIVMDDFSGTFNDKAYVGYPMEGDATFLIADMFVTAEEIEINPEPIFKEMMEFSNPKSTKYKSMKDFMNDTGKGKLEYERRQNGKFTGMF